MGTVRKVEISNLSVILKSIKDVEDACHNPRKHERKQIQKLANCITKFGVFVPIIIDENNVIIAGHGRLQAAKLLRMEQIPTIKVEHLTEEEKMAYMIADNKLVEESEWDFQQLAVNFVSLTDFDFDLSFTGFDTPEIDNIMFNFEIEDNRF